MNNIEPFWDDEYKNLDYRKEIFNDEYMAKDCSMNINKLKNVLEKK
jgi:hypothetical protein|tara:strand:+ start:326 stop:463 length:138 start_codon:yes stop_codon:yes gene_type:complete